MSEEHKAEEPSGKEEHEPTRYIPIAIPPIVNIYADGVPAVSRLPGNMVKFYLLQINAALEGESPAISTNAQVTMPLRSFVHMFALFEYHIKKFEAAGSKIVIQNLAEARKEIAELFGSPEENDG
jgi:hypothetical protein